jgi:hypothetical protein
MSEETLSHASAEGDIIRSFCLHPGYKLYRDEIQKIIADSKNTWLTGTEEQAREARLEARGVQKALSLLTKFVVLGDQAKKILANNATPDLNALADSEQSV